MKITCFLFCFTRSNLDDNQGQVLDFNTSNIDEGTCTPPEIKEKSNLEALIPGKSHDVYKSVYKKFVV